MSNEERLVIPPLKAVGVEIEIKGGPDTTFHLKSGRQGKRQVKSYYYRPLDSNVDMSGQEVLENRFIEDASKNFPKIDNGSRRAIKIPGNMGLGMIINNPVSGKITVGAWDYDEEERRVKLDRTIYSKQKISRSYDLLEDIFCPLPEAGVIEHEVTAMIDYIKKFKRIKERLEARREPDVRKKAIGIAYQAWINDIYTGKRKDSRIDYSREQVEIPEELRNIE